MARVLLVEDEAAVRTVMARALVGAGHLVTAVNGGEDALAAAGQTTFDAAVVDYDIPPPNGLEVLSKLRETQPLGTRILVSGWLDLPITMSAVNRCEVSRILQKPCTTGALASAVADALQERRRLGHSMAVAPLLNGSEAGRRLDECCRGDVLHLALQPIVTRWGDTVAYEALLRSSHPLLNGPKAVLDAAERSERLPQLCDVVVARAAQVLERLPPPLKLFVNLHPRDLEEARIADHLRPLLPHVGRVVLEVTEHARIDVAAALASTAALRELGFELAVDDLGSGYSSLGLLVALKPRYVKVDMSIVRDIQLDPDKRHMMELICRFARTAGQVVIAEGVETEAEAQVARECGVTLLQGYRFGVPKAWRETTGQGSQLESATSAAAEALPTSQREASSSGHR